MKQNQIRKNILLSICSILDLIDCGYNIPIPASIYTILLVTEIEFIGIGHVGKSSIQSWSVEIKMV